MVAVSEPWPLSPSGLSGFVILLLAKATVVSLGLLEDAESGLLNIDVSVE